MEGRGGRTINMDKWIEFREIHERWIEYSDEEIMETDRI